MSFTKSFDISRGALSWVGACLILYGAWKYRSSVKNGDVEYAHIGKIVFALGFLSVYMSIVLRRGSIGSMNTRKIVSLVGIIMILVGSVLLMQDKEGSGDYSKIAIGVFFIGWITFSISTGSLLNDWKIETSTLTGVLGCVLTIMGFYATVSTKYNLVGKTLSVAGMGAVSVAISMS